MRAVVDEIYPSLKVILAYLFSYTTLILLIPWILRISAKSRKLILHNAEYCLM